MFSQPDETEALEEKSDSIALSGEISSFLAVYLCFSRLSICVVDDIHITIWTTPIMACVRLLVH